eukprot:TRINITY_DN45455_c1_g1_i3.p1 TRINITY_DN45455_c1_g1~~TRINITY_DN45455_c1_g1_i3.p1  ORF type:complete len:451 (-),score=65.14 TRINITY_DN45455_c1_g1_i3:413-1765(-)
MLSSRTCAPSKAQVRAPVKNAFVPVSKSVQLHSVVPSRCACRCEPEGIVALEYDSTQEDPSMMRDWKPLIKVAVSGAAGQICNHLLFMIASGEVYGRDQPLELRLLGSERSREALEGVAMELEDSLYPLLRAVKIGIDPEKVFADADWALLVGAKPRGPGQERADLLDMNGQVFETQGKALEKVAKKTCKVIVVGNPCNTNALIAAANAPSIPARNFHALTRLDENRAKFQLAQKAGVFFTSVDRVAVWGNHSTTQVPDWYNARITGEPAFKVIKDEKWFLEDFTPTVATRGGALIKKWGRSSAASTAVSVADAIRALVTPTAEGDCFSSAVVSDGNPYGVPDGIIYSFPLKSKGDGDWEFVTDFEINDWLRQKIDASAEEIVKEKNCVGHLIPGSSFAACELVGAEDTTLPGEMQIVSLQWERPPFSTQQTLQIFALLPAPYKAALASS